MLSMLLEVVFSIIVLIPIYLILNKVKFHSMKKTIYYFVFATYLSAVYLFVGMPTLQFMRFELSITLIPFIPMLADLKNTILNIILFVPLGIMLPLLWKKYHSLKSTVVFSFLLSLSIELLQILTYRATDINDLIANTLGAILGYFIYSIVSRIIPTLNKIARKKNDIAIIIASVLFVNFFIQPYLATLYYKIT